jgi:16S rRNA (cytosine967-C5)-methyltransferase
MSLEPLLSRFLYYVEKGDPLPIAFKKAREMGRYKIDSNDAYEKAKLLVLQYLSLKGRSRRKKVKEFLQGKGAIVFPDWMEKRLSTLYDIGELKKSLIRKTTWFWVNTLKADEDKVIKSLENKGVVLERDKDYPFLYKLINGNLSKTEEFREYKVVIQDKASVSVVATLSPKKGESIYDMTSAPGVKATLIMVLTENGAKLTLSEVEYKRLIREVNFMKNVGVNLDRVNIIHGDATHLAFSKKFDKVLLDAPCSSSGMISNEPTVLLRLTERKVLELSKLQMRLLDKALFLSNTVVYATCSIFPEEGEEVIKNVSHKVVFSKRFIPYIHGTEGFFVSKLEG